MTTRLNEDNSLAETNARNNEASMAFSYIDDYVACSDLSRRMARIPKEQSKITYEFTHDEALLHQYCLLREEMFKKIWSLENFHASKDVVDDISEIIIARQGLQCVGGGRATFSTEQERQLLPLEADGFSLVEALPELMLDRCNYYEVTRIAVLSEFNKNNVPMELIGRLIKLSIEKECSYGFFISPLTMTRTHRRVINALGYNLTTRRDIELPDREEYEGIKMYLSCVDLTAYLPEQVRAGALELEGA